MTLGVYFFVWYYKINREARGFDTRIEVNPAGALLAVLPGWIIIVPPFISISRTGERIAQMQRSAGLEPTCSSWIGLLLTFVFRLETLYYQLELKRVWNRYGNPPEGSAVALALVRRPPNPGKSWTACGAGTGCWLPLLRRGRQVRLSRRAGAATAARQSGRSRLSGSAGIRRRRTRRTAGPGPPRPGLTAGPMPARRPGTRR